MIGRSGASSAISNNLHKLTPYKMKGVICYKNICYNQNLIILTLRGRSKKVHNFLYIVWLNVYVRASTMLNVFILFFCAEFKLFSMRR